MDFMTAIDIGASSLTAERTHMNVISMNLANAKTTRTPDGGPYVRKSVIMAAKPVDEMGTRHMATPFDRAMRGVEVLHIASDSRPWKRVYEPGHPDADEDGYVFYPDINVVEEMANLMTAQRGYEASVATIDSAKAMYTKALEIGK